MNTYCAPLVDDLLLFCYERDFMMISRLILVTLFKTTSRYLDDFLKTLSVYFDNMVSEIYPSELQIKNTFWYFPSQPFLLREMGKVIQVPTSYSPGADFCTGLSF